GAGKEQDYINNEYIGPESKPVIDEDKLPNKDSSNRSSSKKETTEKPIGSAAEEPKKKKGIFQKIFGKKNKGQ
ncbi:MAG: hypothetical protein ABUT20_25725, partial [Bacteroidota bacterium]